MKFKQNVTKIISIIGLFYLFTIQSYSQINSKNISFELRYPIPIGNNFVNNGFYDGYIGLIDLGVDYNIINLNKLEIGFSLNSSFLKLSKNDVNLMIISPKMKIDYKLDFNKISIIPQVGLGYSNWRFILPYFDEYGMIVQGKKHKENMNGLVFKVASKFMTNNDNRFKWYLNISYEFTKLEKYKNTLDTKYNRNIHLIYPSLGVTWNFKRKSKD